MKSPRSRRQRRLIGTLLVLGVAGLVGGAGLIWKAQRQRPEAYRPDERSEDITSELARLLPPEAPRPRFREVAEAAGLGGFRNFAGERSSQLPEDMGPGLAWGDYDNDGDDDLFLVGAGASMNTPESRWPRSVLFENRGDGMFAEVAAFPEIRVRGNGAAWGDFDGDGFLDLVVVGFDALRLFRNDAGSGRFVRDMRLPDLPGFWTGVAWGDYDQDRRLDLYVCNYVDYRASEADRDRLSDQIGTAVPYTLNPASFAGGRNALFRQTAEGGFTNVAAALKVENPEGRSLGAVWHDFDQDGWLDLYVANDVSDNVYYRNVGGRFEDISHPAWVADHRSAMGLAVGDFDRDGDDDLHITHWVAQENALFENMWADLNGLSARPEVRRPPATTPVGAGSNPPVVPSQRIRFVDIADRVGLGQTALPYVGWGTEFVDLDHDGWLDLVVANGSTIEAEGPGPRRLVPQELFVFWSRAGASFHDLAPLDAELQRPHVSRGLACADYDGDGDMDVAVADLGEGVRLFRNDMAQGRWLKVRLRSRPAAGSGSGSGSAEGSVAIAWLDGVPLRRSVTGSGYLSRGSHTLHWGLGTAARLDRLEVRWHAGGTNVLGDLEPDAMYEVAEGESSARRIPDSGAPTSRKPRQDEPGAAGSVASRTSGVGGGAERRQVLEFWQKQRAAMAAMKTEGNNAKAAELFREAIRLDPRHEDARYYLGLCLASLGDAPGALEALEGLQRLNPNSHRAWQQWGVVRALAARSPSDLEASEAALAKAQSLNPEETGALLILGEVALLRGQADLADERFAAATRTNPRAAGGFFLRGYLAWQRGDRAAAGALLEQAKVALGPEWKPVGTTSEGDVLRRQHIETTPLARYWERWDGSPEPERSYAELSKHLPSARPSRGATEGGTD